MTAIPFDTLKFVEKLEKAGIPREHAKAKGEALAEVLDAGAASLATQTDLKSVQAALQADIRTLEERFAGKFTLLQWMIGFSLVLNTAVLLKLMAQ